MTKSTERVTSIDEIYAPKTLVEKDGVEAILTALSPEEKASMTDPGMPLRYFRAEKVRMGHREPLYCPFRCSRFSPLVQSNVPKAVQKLRDTLKWREEYGVERLVNATQGAEKDQEIVDMLSKAVSYTHLTLPTIYSV